MRPLQRMNLRAQMTALHKARETHEPQTPQSYAEEERLAQDRELYENRPSRKKVRA